MAIRFSLRDRGLLVEDIATGDVIWYGKFDDSDVVLVAPIQNTNDCIVLLDYYSHSKGPNRALGNLMRCNANGSVLWRADLLESFDTYVDASLTDDGLQASTWSGHKVFVDIETGKILRSRFTK